MNHKVILCGNSAVGKTCLTQVLANKTYDPNNGPTMGSGFTYINLNYKNENVIINFWDTAGQETYRSMIRIYFYGSDIALVCFDITSRESFLQVPEWFKLIEENCKGFRPSGIIVANKADLIDKREVSDEEIQQLSNDYACDWIIVSALNKDNIKELQDKVAELLLKKRIEPHCNPFKLPQEAEPPHYDQEVIIKEKEQQAPIVDIKTPTNNPENQVIDAQKTGGCSC